MCTVSNIQYENMSSAHKCLERARMVALFIQEKGPQNPILTKISWTLECRSSC